MATYTAAAAVAAGLIGCAGQALAMDVLSTTPEADEVDMLEQFRECIATTCDVRAATYNHGRNAFKLGFPTSYFKENISRLWLSCFVKVCVV